jgi:hypothetical protein
MSNRLQYTPNGARVGREGQEDAVVVRKHVVEQLREPVPACESRFAEVGGPEGVLLCEAGLEVHRGERRGYVGCGAAAVAGVDAYGLAE